MDILPDSIELSSIGGCLGNFRKPSGAHDVYAVFYAGNLSITNIGVSYFIDMLKSILSLDQSCGIGWIDDTDCMLKYDKEFNGIDICILNGDIEIYRIRTSVDKVNIDVAKLEMKLSGLK